jgi:DNA-binding CsgD family transcriptional regulator
VSEATPAVNGAPTVALVHGAWTDGSGWAGLIATLPRAGMPVLAPANPLRDMSGTIDELRRVVDAIAEGLRAPETPAAVVAAPKVADLPSRTDSGSPSDPAPCPLGLSGREIEVLRLVADGLTNAQIAERLFISPKTVSTHLVSIFGKLGVTSRAGATRAAVEHALI